MLTLREPIQMVLSRPFHTLPHSFENRIMGNYRMLDCHITAQELLYLTSAPPELYYSENNLFAVTQVMNRILLEEKAGFTYQDRVYITNILHKMGVKDAETFVSQVRTFREQYRNMDQLMKLYWNNHEVLREVLAAAGKTGCGRAALPWTGWFMSGLEPEIFMKRQPCSGRFHLPEAKVFSMKSFRRRPSCGYHIPCFLQS